MAKKGEGPYSGSRGELAPRPMRGPGAVDQSGNPVAPKRDVSPIADRNAAREGGYSSPLDKGS